MGGQDLTPEDDPDHGLGQDAAYFKKKLDDSLVSHLFGNYYTVQHEDRVVLVLRRVEGPDARWVRVQDAVTGETRDLHSRSLIRRLTELEVIAWAARTKT